MALSLTAERIELARDVWLLPGRVRTAPLVDFIEAIAREAPFRNMTVPGGRVMSIAITNCGACGWVSDASGYRYAERDPESGLPWPAMPPAFAALAHDAAAACGWLGFVPDACLVNRYAVGARLGLHQDRNERDLSQPIVSVSIGASCTFVLGGARRDDPVRSFALHDGDVMVWGGTARLVHHGVRPLKGGGPGTLRYNLTFRKAR